MPPTTNVSSASDEYPVMKDAFGAFPLPFRTEERMRGEESADLRFDDSTVCQILAAAAGSLSKMSPDRGHPSAGVKT